MKFYVQIKMEKWYYINYIGQIQNSKSGWIGPRSQLLLKMHDIFSPARFHPRIIRKIIKNK